MPMKRAGNLRPACSDEIGKLDVFDAITASSERLDSSSVKIPRFNSRSSLTDSITKEQGDNSLTDVASRKRSCQLRTRERVASFRLAISSRVWLICATLALRRLAVRL